jgi:predicted kinase
VIVRGPLGSGKSTVSQRLAQRISAQYVSVDEILRANYLESWDRDRISEASFLRANGFVAHRALPLLRSGTAVVIDGNFYWRSAIDDLVGRLPYRCVVLTLRVPLSICIERDAGRTPSYGARATAKVYEMTTAFQYGTEIDATGSVDQVEGLIVEAVRLIGSQHRESPVAGRSTTPLGE